MAQSPARLVLTRARGMIADEQLWLKYAWKVSLEDGRFRRCAYQAVYDAAQEYGLPASGSFKILMRILGDGRRAASKMIPIFNDGASHAEVIKLFDLAIEDA